MYSSLKIHRRGRALRKLAKQLNEGKVVMTSRSLQDYIMPYAMTALLDEKMLKVTYLLTNLHDISAKSNKSAFGMSLFKTVPGN